MQRRVLELIKDPLLAPLEPEGKTLRNSYQLADALEQIGVQRFRHRGNSRYFALGTKAQRCRVRIALPRTPYPKQPAQIGGDEVHL